MLSRRLLSAMLLALAGCAPHPEPEMAEEPAARPVESKPKAIELTVVKYDQLAQAIRSRVGQIVVVDVWASWCVPCKKEFHHLVELNKEYGTRGVVCISVSVDAAGSEKSALAFLVKSGAAFTNYRLDEPNKVWQEKWDVNGIPAVFVFDRDGNRAAKFTYDDPDNQFTYEANVIPLVKKLLETK